MMEKVILYSLFLFTLVTSCNTAAYKPLADALHQEDTNSAAKETVEEVETHEEEALAVVPISNSTSQETVEKVENPEEKDRARRLAEACSREIVRRSKEKDRVRRLAEACSREIVCRSAEKDRARRLAEACSREIVRRSKEKDRAVVPISNSAAKETVEMEHHANIVPWQILCQAKKAILKIIPISETGELSIPALEKLLKLLTPKTKEEETHAVVPIPHQVREAIIDRYIHFTFGRGVNEPNTLGETPLVEVMKNPDTDDSSMFMLLESPGIELDRRVQDEAGHTALHVAAQEGHDAAVRVLLDKGADMNAKDNDGHTALHMAVIHGKSDVVRTLLDKGADVNAKTKSWRTALREGKKPVITLDNDGHTALHMAVIHGKSDVVRTLLDKGANVNAKTRGWWTALHMAAMYGKSDIVRILLDKGANVNAIHRRYSDGYDACIPLLDNKGRVYKKTYMGCTALSEAISNGHQAVATLLRDAGAHR